MAAATILIKCGGSSVAVWCGLDDIVTVVTFVVVVARPCVDLGLHGLDVVDDLDADVLPPYL